MVADYSVVAPSPFFPLNDVMRVESLAMKSSCCSSIIEISARRLIVKCVYSCEVTSEHEINSGMRAPTTNLINVFKVCHGIIL